MIEGEPCREARDGEGGGLHAVRADAGEHRRLLVAADGEDPPPEGGPRQREGQDYGEDRHDPHCDEDAARLVAPEPGEGVQTNGDQPSVGDDDGDTLEDQTRGDGGEERMHPERIDHHAVHGAENQADEGRQEEAEIGIHMERDPGRHDRAHGEDRRHREVEPARR